MTRRPRHSRRPSSRSTRMAAMFASRHRPSGHRSGWRSTPPAPSSSRWINATTSATRRREIGWQSWRRARTGGSRPATGRVARHAPTTPRPWRSSIVMRPLPASRSWTAVSARRSAMPRSLPSGPSAGSCSSRSGQARRRRRPAWQDRRACWCHRNRFAHRGRVDARRRALCRRLGDRDDLSDRRVLGLVTEPTGAPGQSRSVEAVPDPNAGDTHMA